MKQTEERTEKGLFLRTWNETYIKNVCDTLSNRSDKDTKYTKNKSTQNSKNFSDNMKETIDKFIDDLVEEEETALGSKTNSLTVHEDLKQYV